MSHPLTEKLNPEQAAAVELPAEHALILAGAGSGKTRVLTTRIAWLLSTGQISPSGLMAVTFTNKSAKEMLSRITSMLPLNPRGLWVGTFHGLCNRMLRLHHRDAGLPEAFAILDTQEQLAAIKRVLKLLNLDDDKYPPRTVQQYINGHKENGRRAGDVDAWDDYSRHLRIAYEEYEKQCNREGVADFSELLLRCYELLSHNAPIRQHYQQRFAHILVDEFQDTNRLQYAWLRLLAGEQGAIFAVGDDDQSIYAFRGANVGNMQDFQRDYAVKHVIRLEQNYRSHGNILDAANAVIANNKQRLGKQLWTDASTGEPIRVFEGASDFEEANFIVEEAQTLIREGMPPSDVAILYRSNAQSRIIEHALFSAGVPYRVYGGLRFFERQEIKHALAYLRLIANPSDDNALLRVINFPTRGIGARSVEGVQEKARLEGSTLWQAACGVGGRSAASIGKFVHMIEAMRNQADGLPMTEIVAMMLDLSGLLEHYRNEKDGEERVANLEELINAAATFSVEEDQNPLIAFLSHASLEAGDHQAGAHEEALQLMTVHAAKGLEFKAVFLSGLEEGLFPHDNSANDPQGIEEERRLMYVAITRARERLYLTLAQSRMLHGQTRYGVASRFMDEIPQSLLKFLNRGYAPSSYSAGTAYNAAPAPKLNKSTPEHGLAIGMTVEHHKFGRGMVTDHEGGATGNVQVNFEQHGSKWLAVAYAKLKPLS
ncbi:UvrD-helicase domain-containing protein [Chitinibacter bivalviorum]|uniref:DNA 3'-5' helicase n=1 Tax=Chitinibacter bivalviorum TaxID=2739434 RepID=A0A7H9BLS5_9NEIS|nr:UvrD-helicase domain-containing protein [Chitinibacter bivalviorum]QLG89543.1 UvrD-helicase domain-containing protein [Chitinibacter bivalviorum]